MSGFAKIKRGCCFVRFQPCQDSESRGDRYEEKILADIIPFRRFGGTFIVTVHVSSRLDNGDLMFSDTGIGSKYYRGKIWMEIFTRESGNQKGYNLSDRKNTRISLWSYFGGRSMASSLEHFCLIKDSVTLGLNREVINYEEKILADIIQYRRFYFILTVIVQLCKRHGRLFFIFSAGSFWRNCGKGFYWIYIFLVFTRSISEYNLSTHECF